MNCPQKWPVVTPAAFRFTISLQSRPSQAKISDFQALAGWRLYVTNASSERLSLEKAVFSDREQWQPERGFHRFKRGRLPALPIYFQDNQKIRGLMFLLTIALQVFTLMEFVVRRQLVDRQQSLAGLYDGNPKRTTQRPTTERLLAAFNGITLYFHLRWLKGNYWSQSPPATNFNSKKLPENFRGSFADSHQSSFSRGKEKQVYSRMALANIFVILFFKPRLLPCQCGRLKFSLCFVSNG